MENTATQTEKTFAVRSELGAEGRAIRTAIAKIKEERRKGVDA